MLVEALARGLPIVATSIGGIPEIVDESDERWDESRLSRRFSRDWAAAAAETRVVCEANLNDRATQGTTA